jgi:hypothetical protein
MEDINIRHLDMGRRVRDFAGTNAAAFPAGTRASELIAVVSAAVAALEAVGAKQDAARVAGKQATDQKDAARAALLDRMRPINRTARGMEKLFPGIGAQFAMPRGGGDQPVLNRAQAFVAQATPIAVEFTKRGLPANFVSGLAAAINPMMSAIEAQNEALGEETAATAAVTAAQAQLKDAVRELSPIVSNVFHDDPARLAAWQSASRVERAPKKKKAAPPPPPPPVK